MKLNSMVQNKGKGDNEFNPKIFWKLIRSLKKYWPLTLFALVALAFSTIGELRIPVLIQQTLDEHILGEYVLLNQDGIQRAGNLGFDIEGTITTQGVLLSENKGWDPLPDHLKKEIQESNELIGPGIRIQKSPSFQGELLWEEGSQALISREVYQNLEQEVKRSIRQEDLEQIIQRSLELAMLLIGVMVFSFAQVLTLTWISQLVMKDLRMNLFHHFLGQSMNYHNQTPQGKMVGAVTNDVDTINEFFNVLFTSLLKDLAMITGVIFTLFALDFTLASYTMLILPPVALLLGIFRAKSRKAGRKVRQDVSQLNTFLSEHLSGMKVVQMFGKEEPIFQDFQKHNTQLRNSYLKERAIMAIFRPLMDFLSSVTLGILIYFGGSLLGQDLLSIGILIAFINLVQKFFQPLNNLTENFTTLQSALAGAERVFGFGDTQGQIPDTGKTSIKDIENWRLKFDQVHFSYKEDEPVLKNISFQVEEGSIVALVGYTGSGKTTITNLLTRFWDVNNGSIQLGGEDIQNFPLKDLRANIQAVLQDVVLFSGTILENITLGREVDPKKVEEICQQVQAHSFISKLPQGYNTLLEEGATNLSAGQRQLLSFARVLLQDPKVLLLDEATANIDSETEDLIQKALDVLLSQRTVLVVAHRLSTIKRANRILVLDRGKIVEQGTHDELMKGKGFYYDLYQFQLEKGDIKV